MAYPVFSPIRGTALCQRCGNQLETIAEINNKGDAVNRLTHHCDHCKCSFVESVQYIMGSYVPYTAPEDRKAQKAAAAKNAKKPHVPMAAVPVGAGLRGAGNAAQ